MAQLMPLPLTVSCFCKIQIGFASWYWLTWVVLDKGPLNRCVYVCVFQLTVRSAYSVCACFFGQVDSVEKIEKLLKGNATELGADDITRWHSVDYNCLLIEVLKNFHSDYLQL